MFLCRSFIFAVMMAATMTAHAADTASVVKKWQFPADSAAWTAQNDLELKSTKNAIVLTAKGGDPQLTTKVDGPEGWKSLVVKAKFRGQISGQIFWTTKSQPATGEQASSRFSGRGRGDNSVELTIFFQT